MQSRPHARVAPQTAPSGPGRYFYGVAALLILITTAIGFSPFYLGGEGMAGRKIAPEIFPLVAVHGTFMTLWVVLFLVQSLLVSARRRRVHITLGWVGIAVAGGVAVSGVMVAIESVRPVPTSPFWGMAYQQFLLIMLTEVAVFTAFVVAGSQESRLGSRGSAGILGRLEARRAGGLRRVRENDARGGFECDFQGIHGHRCFRWRSVWLSPPSRPDCARLSCRLPTTSRRSERCWRNTSGSGTPTTRRRWASSSPKTPT